MKILRRNITAALGTSIMMLFTSAANAQVERLVSSFTNYQQKNLHEKLFVHTDKGFYLTGELLWLKIYNVDAATSKPLQLSKVAYVELLDKNQTPVVQAKIALSNATGNGSLYIPVNLNNGNYKLRAYTNWMKNYSPDLYFEKQISIVNPLKSPEVTAKEPLADDYEIQFFPEGGTLLAGYENKIGVRLVGANGKGVNLPGVVINLKNDTLVRFKPLVFGLGSFILKPDAGANYRAVFKINGKTVVKNLPAVSSQGYQMTVTDNGDNKLNVRVNSSDQAKNVYLVAYCGATVSVAQTVMLSNNTTSFIVDLSRLAAGVTHLVIFNEMLQPVCERLYYKRPVDELGIKANTDQPTYSTRKKVDLDYVSQVGSQGLPAKLSLSVYRIDSLQKPDDISIRDYLWLTSELHGNVESPGYYFKNINKKTDEALDNLMVVQGWRQFDWNAALTDRSPAVKFLPEYNGHLITGKIVDNTTNAPAPGVIAYLGIPSTRVQMYTAQSDSLGNLAFNTRDMYGTGEIIVQTNYKRDTTYRIDIQSPFSEQYSLFNYPSFNVKALPKNVLENYSIGMQVQNLYGGARLKQYYNPQIDSSAFYFKPNKAYMLDDFTRFTTMEEVLREYVTEVNVVKPRNQFRLITLSPAGILTSEPLILVDGVPVFNTNRLLAMDPLKVRRLEVVNNHYYYNATFNDGIFSFTSYKGDLGGIELDPRAVVLDYEGMQLERKFYSPVYETESDVKSHLPDFRNVLYWLPNADTGAGGKSHATFYTSDQAGKYIVVIQGITANGLSGSGFTTFEVNK